MINKVQTEDAARQEGMASIAGIGQALLTGDPTAAATSIGTSIKDMLGAYKTIGKQGFNKNTMRNAFIKLNPGLSAIDKIAGGVLSGDNKLREQAEQEQYEKDRAAFITNMNRFEKGGLVYRPDHVVGLYANKVVPKKKRHPQLAQSGTKLMEFNRPVSMNNENTLSLFNIDLNPAFIKQVQQAQKDRPYRNLAGVARQDNTVPLGRSYKKGGKACGCEEEDLDFLPESAVTIIREMLGMGNGPMTKNVKKYIKIEAAKKGMKLGDYLCTSTGLQLVPVMRSGGKIKDNVILNGVFHSRKNSIEDLDVTPKGVPVVSIEEGGVIQHAEVEKNELVLSRSNTEKLEDYIARIDAGEDLKEELGRWFKKELLTNTQDSKDKLLKS